MAVSSTGRATAISTGSATIEVSAAGGERDAIDVTVDAARWTAVGTGEDFACGLARDGDLGIGSDASEARIPTPVASPLQFVAVSAGFLSSCALDAEGRAWYWGANAVGWLGSGDTDDTTVPVPVEGDRIFSHLSAGLDQSCAVEEATGDVFCWGLNNGRQLASDTEPCNPEIAAACSLMPVQVPLDRPAESVAVGGFTPGFACSPSDTGMWCWGNAAPAPLRFELPGGGFEAIAGGLDESFGIADTGFLFSWDGRTLGAGPTLTFFLVPQRRVDGASAIGPGAAPEAGGDAGGRTGERRTGDGPECVRLKSSPACSS